MEFAYVQPPVDVKRLPTYLANRMRELSSVLDSVHAQGISEIIDQNAVYTFAAIHRGLSIRHTGATARIWTVPDDPDILPGSKYFLFQLGAGAITLRGATGISVTFFDQTTAGGLTRTAGDFTLANPCIATLQKSELDTLWYLSGDNIT